MRVRRIPEDETTRIPLLNKIILVVRKQPNAKIRDYIACIKKNGELVDRGEPLIPDDSREIDIIGIETEPIETDTISDSEHIEDEPILDERPNGEDILPGNEAVDEEQLSDKEQADKEDEDKEKEVVPIPYTDWIKKGIAVGLSTLLLTAALGLKQKTHETLEIPADRASEESISDIELIELGGQYIQYTGSVYKDPGVLIHDMRDLGLGEDLLLTESRDEYLKSTTGESRVAEEENILEISNQFQEQQRIIFENEQILKSSASESEKLEALSKIISAKSSIQRLYLDNKDLYDYYVRLAKEAHDRYGGDERSEQEDEMADYDGVEFDLAINNLSVDIASLSDSLYILSNPQVLFDEPLAPEGTIETTYLVDTEVLGHDIQLGEISSTEVTDLDYYTNTKAVQKGETITSGTVVIDGKAIQRTETTRNGLFAVPDIITRKATGKEVGEVTLFGKKLADDPHIYDNR